MKQIIKFLCETCNVEYNTPRSANECESLGVEDQLFQVGDNLEFKDNIPHPTLSHFQSIIVDKVEAYKHNQNYTVRFTEPVFEDDDFFYMFTSNKSMTHYFSLKTSV